MDTNEIIAYRKRLYRDVRYDLTRAFFETICVCVTLYAMYLFARFGLILGIPMEFLATLYAFIALYLLIVIISVIGGIYDAFSTLRFGLSELKKMN